jgi:hypothetical protein
MHPITHVSLAAGPAYLEHIQRLPSKFSVTLKAESDNRFHLFAVAVYASGEKIGYLPPDVSRHYFSLVKSAAGVECQGRRAPISAHENTGVDVLLDLTDVPCEA